MAGRERDKTSPKQPGAVRREPAVHPTLGASQGFPDELCHGTELGHWVSMDTPCLDRRDSKGNPWGLELATSSKAK